MAGGAWQATSMGHKEPDTAEHTYVATGRGRSLEERTEFWSGFCHKFILRPWVNNLTSLGSGVFASV